MKGYTGVAKSTFWDLFPIRITVSPQAKVTGAMALVSACVLMVNPTAFVIAGSVLVIFRLGAAKKGLL